jgi:hypothetical protein
MRLLFRCEPFKPSRADPDYADYAREVAVAAGAIVCESALGR